MTQPFTSRPMPLLLGRDGNIFYPDGVVIQDAAVHVDPANTLLETHGDVFERGMDALELQAMTGQKIPLSAWSNLQTLFLVTTSSLKWVPNIAFLEELIVRRIRDADLKIWGQAPVVEALATFRRLAQSPRCSSAHLASARAEALWQVCRARAAIDALATLVRNLFKTSTPRLELVELQRRERWPEPPDWLVRRRALAEELHRLPLEDARRDECEAWFRFLTDVAIATNTQAWLPYHRAHPCYGFQMAHNNGQWYAATLGCRDEYYSCVEEHRELAAKREMRNAALKMAMQCARRSAEHAATFAGDPRAEPGLAAFARLARSLGGAGSGGTESALILLILKHVRVEHEARYDAACVQFRNAIVSWHRGHPESHVP